MASDTGVPVVTKADLLAALRTLGFKAGDTVLVHSSIKSLGRFDGTPNDIIDAMLELVGPEGTIALPTLTGAARDGEEGPLRFDARSTPCWTGTLCETLRKRSDARRSAHPTHSIAAVGKRARWLTDDHHLAETPCGKGSPWLKLAEIKAHILFLGVKLNSCTLLHGVEELANSLYHMKSRPAEAFVIDQDGREHHGHFLVHCWNHARRFHDAVYPELVERRLIRQTRVGNADLVACRADEFVNYTLPRLKAEPAWLLAGYHNP